MTMGLQRQAGAWLLMILVLGLRSLSLPCFHVLCRSSLTLFIAQSPPHLAPPTQAATTIIIAPLRKAMERHHENHILSTTTTTTSVPTPRSARTLMPLPNVASPAASSVSVAETLPVPPGSPSSKTPAVDACKIINDQPSPAPMADGASQKLPAATTTTTNPLVDDAANQELPAVAAAAAVALPVPTSAITITTNPAAMAEGVNDNNDLTPQETATAEADKKAAGIAAAPARHAFTSADLPLRGSAHTKDTKEDDDAMSIISEVTMPEEFQFSHGLTFHEHDSNASSSEKRNAGKTYKLYELLLPTVKKAGKCT